MTTPSILKPITPGKAFEMAQKSGEQTVIQMLKNAQLREIGRAHV